MCEFLGELKLSVNVNGLRFEPIENEILPNMAKAYSLNHPTAKVYAEDIKDFNAEKIEKEFPVVSFSGKLGLGNKQIELLKGTKKTDQIFYPNKMASHPKGLAHSSRKHQKNRS